MIKPVIYNGDDPYIFISYSHKDTEIVWPILLQMQKDGYRFWYDDGIEAGSSWDDIISQHVQEGGYFIAFLSDAYLQSDNCQQELKFAISKKKTVLTVYMHELLLPAGLEMRLSTSQAVSYSSEDELDFFEKLGEAVGIEQFRASAETEEARPSFKDLSDRCSKAMKASCYCEALYLEREAMDVCLTNCLYHMGLLHKTSSPRIRDGIRPLVLNICGNENVVECPVNLGISSLENKIGIMRLLFRWAKQQPDNGQKCDETELQSIAAQLNQIPVEKTLRILQDVDVWRREARTITGDLSHNKASVTTKALPDLATEGHRCIHELAKIEKGIRKGNRIRRTMRLPLE